MEDIKIQPNSCQAIPRLKYPDSMETIPKLLLDLADAQKEIQVPSDLLPDSKAARLDFIQSLLCLQGKKSNVRGEKPRLGLFGGLGPPYVCQCFVHSKAPDYLKDCPVDVSDPLNATIKLWNIVSIATLKGHK